MKTTPIFEKRIVKILSGLVPVRHRDFIVEFKPGAPKTCVASYRRTSNGVRAVTVYTGHFDNSLDIVGTILHELAHHLAYNSYPTLRLKHGRVFRNFLNMLIARANYRLSDKILKGRFVWNRRKPTRSPRFVKI